MNGAKITVLIFFACCFLTDHVWSAVIERDTEPNPDGTCPIVPGPGPCVEECTSDSDCPYPQKCCSNGCGHVCLPPV